MSEKIKSAEEVASDFFGPPCDCNTTGCKADREHKINLIKQRDAEIWQAAMDRAAAAARLSWPKTKQPIPSETKSSPPNRRFQMSEKINDIGSRLALRKRMLVQDHGTPEKQKAELLDKILSSFQDPSKWPMSDDARVELLKALYRMAITIKDTEAAIACAPEVPHA